MKISLLKSNISFVIMAFFSLCYFISSFIAKKSMSDDDFYYWNVLITLISASFSFCFLGAEQLFVRFGKVNCNNYEVPRDTILLMFSSNILYFIFLVFVVNRYFFIIDSIETLFFVSIFPSFSVLCYNFSRMRKKFVTAQLLNNSWKPILLIGVFIANFFSVVETMVLMMLVSFSISALYIFKNRGHLTISNDKQPKEWKTLFLGFSLSLFVMVLLNSIDRVIVEKIFTQEEFSSYVYLLSILIMPFSLISSYFGFKEVAYLKSEYVKEKFRKKTYQVALISSVLFTLWFIIIFLSSDILELELAGGMFIPALLLVVSKCVYSMFSSIFGLKAKAKDIQMANVITVILIFFICLILLNIKVSIYDVILSISILWIGRCFIFLIYIKEIKEYKVEYNEV